MSNWEEEQESHDIALNTDWEETLKEIEKATEETFKLNCLDDIYNVIDNRIAVQESVESALRAKEEENKELQRQLDVLKTKASIQIQRYESESEERKRYQEDLLREKAFQQEQEQEQQELAEEIELIQRELDELQTPKSTSIADDADALKLAIYRGLGVNPMVGNDDQVHKIVLTSPDRQDILPINIDDYPPDFTVNTVWKFISEN